MRTLKRFDSLLDPKLDGEWQDGRGNQVLIERTDEEELGVESGRLLFCDPLTNLDVVPLARRVPKGQHPVVVASAERRVACVIVQFGRPRPVRRWESATREDGAPATVSTDAAICAVFDAEMLDRVEHARKTKRSLFDVEGSTTVAPSASNPKLSILISSTGYGDGTYAACWGVDAKDKPVALVLDFKVLDWGTAGAPSKRKPTAPKPTAPKPAPSASPKQAGRAGRVQRFELVQGASKKFWEIAVTKASMTVRWGRLDTTGQTQTKTFGSAEQARTQAERLVAEKLKKGYRRR